MSQASIEDDIPDAGRTTTIGKKHKETILLDESLGMPPPNQGSDEKYSNMQFSDKIKPHGSSIDV